MKEFRPRDVLESPRTGSAERLSSSPAGFPSLVFIWFTAWSNILASSRTPISVSSMPQERADDSPTFGMGLAGTMNFFNATMMVSLVVTIALFVAVFLRQTRRGLTSDGRRSDEKRPGHRLPAAPYDHRRCLILARLFRGRLSLYRPTSLKNSKLVASFLSPYYN
jgi:hypothetical protein